MLILHEEDIAIENTIDFRLMEHQSTVFELRFIVRDWPFFAVAVVKYQNGVFFPISRLISLGEMKPEITAVIDVTFVRRGIPVQRRGPHPLADLAKRRLHRRRRRVVVDDRILRVKHLLTARSMRQHTDQENCRKLADRTISFHV